jgi:penicillin G amidase
MKETTRRERLNMPETPTAHRIRRRLKRVGLALAIGAGLLGLLFAGGYLFLRRSLPRLSGNVTAAGLAGPIDIVRDAHAIPHIFAQSEADAYFGLGYVHAQDRLWQLELNRRLGSGTLAEVLGPDALEQDRLFRTIGLRQLAERNVEQLDAPTRAALDGYARGVNAFLSEKPPLPPEFLAFQVTPREWTPADSLVWLEVMGWWMSSTIGSELLRVRLRSRLSSEQIAELLAPYPGDEPISLGDFTRLYGQLDAPAQVLGALVPVRHGSLGSNNWAVGGSHTESGKPLLANDPHLDFSAPSVWYLAHLQAPGLDVIGASLPSLPAIVLGRNDRVAWAFTNTESDTQDLFVEKLSPDDPERYLTPNGSEAFSTRQETIRVRGAADLVLTVRASRHGPILSDVDTRARASMPEGYALAVGWVGFSPHDRTLQFPIKAAHAQSADELLAAARDFESPQQNIVYADAQHIGFVAAGRLPQRRADNELRGMAPAPGWLERYDWQGFVPFDELPQLTQPTSDRIVTANQKITAPDYAHWVTSDWAPPYRAQRIEALLEATPRHSVQTFSAVQADVRSGSAQHLLGSLLREASPSGERSAQLLDRLHGWDLEMRADTLEPLLFAAWVREVARAVYADELGPQFDDAWGERPLFLANVLSDLHGQSRWCDDVNTLLEETCRDIVSGAFQRALEDLARRYGNDPEQWTWGRAHPVHSSNLPLSEVPLIGRWFDIDVPGGGDNQSVNVAGYSIEDDSDPFRAHVGPGYRAIYDLADPDASLFILSAGESGHFLSPYYRDASALWARGQYAPMQTQRARVEQGSIGLLRLTPAQR